MAAISDGKVIGNIVEKFLHIINTKDVTISRGDKYYIRCDGYTLVVEEDSEDDHHLRISFYSGTGEELCHYNFTISEDEHLYAQICDRLLAYCDEKLQYTRKMKIVQEFLDNH